MTPIIDKALMTEEDIKLNYITPAIQARGWKDRITMETAVKVTDGKVNLRGNIAVRGNPKKADYLLYLCANNPIAVVEAKDNSHSVSFGLQQAMTYAVMLDLPFAYSSNGDGFAEHDFLTGLEREIPLDAFPTRRPSSVSPITLARRATRPAITSASPSTAPSTASRKGSGASSSSWPPAPARPTPPFRLSTAFS